MAYVESGTLGRTLMRIITSLIISCLIISTGCAESANVESPYDVAQRRWEEPDDVVQPEQEELDRWTPILIADAMAELQPLIDQSNEEFRILRDTIRIYTHQFPRVVYFQEILDDADGIVSDVQRYPDAVHKNDGRYVVENLPDGILQSRWTDELALIEQFTCEAEMSSAKLTRSDLSDPEPFEVTIEVKVVGTRQRVVAREPDTIPQPPEGYEYWGESYGSGGRCGLHLLPGPTFSIRTPKPPGPPYQPGQSSLADHAVKMLAQAKPQPINHRGLAVLRYNTREDSWAVVVAWMNSSGHRANILNPRNRRIGIAAYRTPGGTIYWCQQFRS